MITPDSSKRLTEFYRGKSVLVTGHRGFIGGTLFGILQEMGADVSGLDYRDQTDVDLTCQERVAVFFPPNPDVVFHLAASTEVRASLKYPHSTIFNNVNSTLNVLEKCRTAGNSLSLVIASSDKAYGQMAPWCNEYREGDDLHADADPYSMSKTICDMMAMRYARLYPDAMDVKVLRACNVYGPGQRNETTLVTSLTSKLLRGEPAVLYEHSQSRVREWMFIDDVVEAYLLLGAHRSKPYQEAFNVGTGVLLNPKDVFAEVSAVLGKTDPPLVAKDEPNSRHVIGDQTLNCGRFRKTFPEWTPTPWSDGIETTVKWYRETHKREGARR